MKPHLFLDTNVILDFFLARDPQGPAAAQVFHLATLGKLRASTSAVSFCNTAYLLQKLDRSRVVERDLQQLLQIVQIVPNTTALLGEALESPLTDYEDAVQYRSALTAHCTHLLTDNTKHYRRCAIPVLSPKDFVERCR